MGLHDKFSLFSAIAARSINYLFPTILSSILLDFYSRSEAALIYDMSRLTRQP